MRPFRKYMLLDYAPVIKIGFFGDSQHSQPWELTIRVISWWGLRDRIIKKTVEIPFGFDAFKFYDEKLNKWLTK